LGGAHQGNRWRDDGDEVDDSELEVEDNGDMLEVDEGGGLVVDGGVLHGRGWWLRAFG
jgi:hypothetical protein